MTDLEIKVIEGIADGLSVCFVGSTAPGVVKRCLAKAECQIEPMQFDEMSSIDEYIAGHVGEQIIGITDTDNLHVRNQFTYKALVHDSEIIGLVTYRPRIA